MLGFLVSATMLYIAFPFFTYVPSTGWLGDSLPQVRAQHRWNGNCHYHTRSDTLGVRDAQGGHEYAAANDSRVVGHRDLGNSQPQFALGQGSGCGLEPRPLVAASIKDPTCFPPTGRPGGSCSSGPARHSPLVGTWR